MEPEEDERFYPSKAKEITEKVIEEELANRQYDDDMAKSWSLNISDRVRELVHESLPKSRFKIVVQTVIGAKADQAIRVASRCLWDANFDNYASATWSNSTLFCTVLVFALYTD